MANDSTIVYNFASRSRPEQFKRAIKSIYLNSKSDNFRIVAKFDEDDPELYKYMANSLDVAVKLGRSRNKVHAINRDLHLGYWDGIIVNMSDDMIFTVSGFDNIIREGFDHGNFLHFPDGFANDRVCTLSIMSKPYFDQFGYIYHPSYKSLWCDNEATDVAKMLGAYKYIDKQIFEHLHPAANKAEFDDQYRKTESFYHIDKKNYLLRKALNFPL